VKYLVSFSGGVTSWAAAKRVRESDQDADITLVFANTRIEDEDTYRFLVEAAGNVRAPMVVVQEGRTPWQVFRDQRFIGNTRVDLCSRVLKREPLKAWIEANHSPDDSVIVLGFTADEPERIDTYRRWVSPWPVLAPLADAPGLDHEDCEEWCKREGMMLPRLYRLGFKHNNCGGFCVKAGHEQFSLLLRTMPERYRAHEAEEEATRQLLGRDVAILRDRRGGQVKPLTLQEFRRRAEAREDLDSFGGTDCACFTPDADTIRRPDGGT